MINPLNHLKKGDDELPKVEQLGTISLEKLNEYHCDNPERRLMSLFGKVYDVTSAVDSYGPDGAYKEFPGHDITLALAHHKTDTKWMDRFVVMKENWVSACRDWEKYFDVKYPVAGRLEKWDENQDEWASLTPEEEEELEKGCSIM